ncbi:MAG TPA: CheB methylesterase domain-containing protein [Candidatus Polarisedimenticolia bacterium]
MTPPPDRAPRRARAKEAGDIPPADLVVVGCSAGGPPALQMVLPALPRGTSTSALVAQHMPARFTSLFAGRLARLCALPVIEPVDGAPLLPGHIYIAAGGMQTTLERSSRGIVFRVRQRGEGERYAPSADLMMGSAARLFGARALAILLTGMGSDGVIGLRDIKGRRGRTVAESEETATVFGMPREAIRAGLADQILPLPEIRSLLARVCR